MRRLFISFSLLVTSLLMGSPSSAEPNTNTTNNKHERPTITTSMQGKDLVVVVHHVTDYCRTDADTEITRTSDTIRILRDKPTKLSSRCFDTQDLTFVVKDVAPGRYAISYERMPLVAPARPRQVATGTAFVSN
jgi:hypothetical protein